MAAEQKYEEPPLEKTTIYRGPQAPVLSAYVPLPVLGIELMVLIFLWRLFGPWALILSPIHLVLAAKTSENPYWPRDLHANINHRWFAGNKNDKGVVVFTPHTSRKELL